MGGCPDWDRARIEDSEGERERDATAEKYSFQHEEEKGSLKVLEGGVTI